MDLEALRRAPDITVYQLFTVTHPDLAEPIYCVRGSAKVEFKGVTYLPYPIDISFDDLGAPTIRFEPPLSPLREVVKEYRDHCKVRMQIVVAKDDRYEILKTVDDMVFQRQ